MAKEELIRWYCDRVDCQKTVLCKYENSSAPPGWYFTQIGKAYCSLECSRKDECCNFPGLKQTPSI